MLCLDLIERPEITDWVMTEAGRIFRELWRQISEMGRMAELGCRHTCYSLKGRDSAMRSFLHDWPADV